MIWVTSDTHLNHKNIIAYCPASRPFSSVEEMNEALITNWNSCVAPEDTIIHCGDFFMGPLDAIEPILNRLNGHIILIQGNHDTPQRIELFKAHGIEVHDIYYLPYKGRFFIFCHFPIDSVEFRRMVNEDNSETILCYGHVHDHAPKGLVDGTYHVGVDTNDLRPVPLGRIWQASRDWEEQRKIAAIPDEICKTCQRYLNPKDFCKGTDGGCAFYKRKENK